MDRKDRSWLFGAKKKIDYMIKEGGKSCIYYKSQEKLPPRLQFRGISVAARVVGHGIRNFTKKTTGKDLACLRDSKRRQSILDKLSDFHLAVTDKNAKYNLLTLACSHSSNFTTSLSPEELVHLNTDYDNDFGKNNLHDLIAQYHKKCLGNEVEPDKYIVKHSKHRIMKRKAIPSVEEEQIRLKSSTCLCDSPISKEKRGKGSFLNCWEHKGIAETDLTSYYLENACHFNAAEKMAKLNFGDKIGWQEFLKKENCLVFRKKLHSGLYEYRVQASFFDISANHLFTTQLDCEYRKQWDEYVIDLRVADSHKETNSELIHWVTKCPYPFATREYVYLRRNKVDSTNRALILYQQATDETNIHQEKGIHRVDTYVSKIIIKPHSDDFDNEGCDFLLTYYDDPKMMLPTRIIDMAASKGISDSIERMHQAALGLKNTSQT